MTERTQEEWDRINAEQDAKQEAGDRAQWRRDLAKDVLLVMIERPDLDADAPGESLAKGAVVLADALIAELEKPKP